MNYKKISIFLIPFILGSCGENKPEEPVCVDCDDDDDPDIPDPVIPEDPVTFNLPELGNNVSFHTKRQQDYLKDDIENVYLYADGLGENSRPESIDISWSIDVSSEFTETLVKYQLYLSEDDNFSKYETYERINPLVSLINLKIATTYYFKVSAFFTNDKTYTSKVSSFTTEDQGPRNLYIEGITNARDIGGYPTLDGGRVRQGLVYRSGRLNKSEKKELKDSYIEITPYGASEMRDHLGMKNEIDLRHDWKSSDGTYENGGLNGREYSLVGGNVKYNPFPIQYSSVDVFGTNPEEFKSIFEFIADQNNLPLFYHCDIGTDRTGMLSAALLSLCNVDLNYIHIDYLYSNFGKIGAQRTLNNFNKNFSTLMAYPGTSVQAKMKNALMDKTGVSEQTLDQVVANLVERGN